MLILRDVKNYPKIFPVTPIIWNTVNTGIELPHSSQCKSEEFLKRSNQDLHCLPFWQIFFSTLSSAKSIYYNLKWT